MSLKTTLLAAIAATAFALPAAADMAKIMVDDPYARSATSMAKSGAAFMGIMNHSDEDDRLISATSDVAQRVELHTHLEDANGVMRMVEVEEGFEIAAGETIMLKRGGKHVMFMGLNEPFEQGEMIDVTLTFEKAGDVQVQIPVDLERQPKDGAHGGHGDHSHGSHDH
ncbi:copper chaperone PCu(A)C [Cognatishimia sp. MH4019]|uniref:copper chaperone PCu(A)C n=1 Tax=Cognatishimia sp. MH4019 TaxID=2854030 RepID=UPI001CD1C8C6|nr:copper chaperone PCu(A)C [Cognatishimia sp. MH4019]